MLIKGVNFVSRIVIYLAMAVICGMMLLTVADVFMRYVFTSPIIGTLEITEIMLVCTLLAMAPCALVGAHIKVDIITTVLKQRTQTIVEILTLFVGLVFIVIVGWESFEHGLYALEYDIRSSMLEIPNFPFHMVLVFSYLFLGIAMLTQIIMKIKSLVKK